MDIHYVWQKLHQAVLSLVSSLTLKERLSHACGMLIFLKGKGVPNEIKVEFDELMDKIEKAEPVGEEGKINAALNNMTEIEREDIAKKIVGMYNDITRQMKLH